MTPTHLRSSGWRYFGLYTIDGKDKHQDMAVCWLRLRGCVQTSCVSFRIRADMKKWQPETRFSCVFFHLSIFSKTSRLSCDDLWSSSGCIPTCTFKRKQTCVHRLVRHHKCTYSATSRHTDLNFSFCFCLKLYLFCTSNHSLHFCNFLFSHLSCQSKCWGL